MAPSSTLRFHRTIPSIEITPASATKTLFYSLDRLPPVDQHPSFFSLPPFRWACPSSSDTLESSSSVAFLGSIHQPRRSLPRSRPLDSSGCVSIERTWLRRIRCAYVCTRSRVLHQAITRPRKEPRRMLVQANNQPCLARFLAERRPKFNGKVP